MFKGKEVAQLIFGTGFSQLVFIIVTPILTRIFPPDYLGVLGAYLSIISVIVVFLTGRYEMAIVLSNSGRLASGVIKYALKRSILVAVTLSSAIILIFFVSSSLREVISNYYLLYVVFGALMLAFYNITVQATLREEKYNIISMGRIAHSISFGVFGITSSFFIKSSFVILCLSDLLARFVCFCLMVRVTNIFGYSASHKQLRTARQRYARFSRYDQVTATLSILSIQSPMILIPVIFDAATAGLYFVVFRVVMSPVSLIANAVYDVFKVEATRQLQERGTCRPLVVYTIYKLFIYALIPAILLGLFGKILFVTIFGISWAQAGLYAQILAPCVMARFIAAPVGVVLQVREKVRLNSMFYGLFLIATCVSLVIGWEKNSPTIMVVAISISSSLLYGLQIILAYRYSDATQVA